jgi:putative DNA primase/helicase
MQSADVEISIGLSRKETNWKNITLPWSELKAKLSVTRRTHETIKQYLRMDRDRQTEIKDVGGFVGGLITGGRRKKGSVMQRHLITLDADSATPDFWADFWLSFPNEALLYTTHKYTAESPRYRLVLPLTRPVSPDEYQACVRKIAELIGLQHFNDKSTYQVERLMYWPSTASDGIFYTKYQEGAWLNPDDILALYHDWRDTSQWPDYKQDGLVDARIKKQGDPWEKPGVIGAFCREYTVPETIEKFLPDVYEVGTDPDRYTYKLGSVSNGLVIYDQGRYAYSHHGTDPASEKLCNAFDLVRLHKFAHKDENIGPHTPINKYPSFIAMQDFARDDDGVRVRAMNEKHAQALEEFDVLDTDDYPEYPGISGVIGVKEPGDSNDDNDDFEILTPVDDSWKKQLKIDKQLNAMGTINNAMLILKNDFPGTFQYDEFTHRAKVLRHLPWRRIDPLADNEWLDEDNSGIRHYMENRYGLASVGKIEDAIVNIFRANRVHPVRSYLDGLVWDGSKRIERALIEYFGADDNEYVRAVTRKWMIAAVKRIYRPGCKFDNVLTLVGPQGVGKSTFFNKLGGRWFSDSFGTIQGKEAVEQIQGVWLVEMGELAGLKNVEVNAIKHFISKQVDLFRAAYGRNTQSHPRQCVFAATTNEGEFLRDSTGNRRWWVVDCGTPVKSVFDDLSEYVVNQLWAEAVEYYRSGESLHLPKKIEAMATEVQAKHVEGSVWKPLIEEFIKAGEPGSEFGEHLPYTRLTYQEIWVGAIKADMKTFTRMSAKEITLAMSSIPNWVKTTFKKDGISHKGFTLKGF